jgi:hypothetical protein
MKWHKIPETNSMYSINKDGEVMAQKREWITGRYALRRIKPKHVITPFLKANGYYHVNLRINGRQIQHPIHVLMARTFLKNPENKKCVNHIDGVKTNNNLSNLEWATYLENNHHALRTGARVNKSGAENGNSKAIEVFRNGKLIGRFHSLRQGSEVTGIQYDKLRKLSMGIGAKSDFTVKRVL